MADPRIRIDKDKVDILRKLVKSEESPTGPFSLNADVIAFAAALGANKSRRLPLEHPASDPAPIRQDIFERQGYDTVINLLAVCEEENPLVLANEDEMDNKRGKIFEEYANGGLQILKEELTGAVDYLETILLLISTQREEPAYGEEESFDLSKLI